LVALAGVLWLATAVLLQVVVWLTWCSRGRYVLVVDSNSPIWQAYFEQSVLPAVGSRAEVLSWSQAKARDIVLLHSFILRFDQHGTSESHNETPCAELRHGCSRRWARHKERSSATLRSSDHGAAAFGAGADLAEVVGMTTHKSLVTLEDILRLVREDYPEMTAEELQKHLNALVKDGSVIRTLAVCPPATLDYVM
jgi:hypothetical protein